MMAMVESRLDGPLKRANQFGQILHFFGADL